MRLRLESAVFLSGAALMGLEIAGSRVLAPAFGTSVFVWGALITTFLASLALGYAAGGRLADARPDPRVLSNVLAGGALLLWLLFLRPEPLLDLAGRLPVPDRFRSLAAALLLFSAPSVLMGAVTPFAVRLSARDVSSVGTSAGRLSAISTAGSILGTFAMTFFLLPALPLAPILFGLGATLAVSALLLLPRPGWLRTAAVLAAGVGAGTFYLVAPPEPSSPLPGGKVVLQKETAYHRIRVVDQGWRRALYFDNRLQGFVPLAGGDNRERTYHDGFLLTLALGPSRPSSVVTIGLGAGVTAGFLGRHLPEVESVTIEIDPEVVRVAESHFGFRVDGNDRVLVGDGRRELARAVDRTDVILEDAFFADSIPFHLMTRQFYELCRGKLSANGALAANFGGLLTGEGNALFWSAYRTMREVFPRVYVFCRELREGKAVFAGPALLVATMSPERRSRDEVQEAAERLSRELGRPQVAEWAAFLYDGEIRGEGLPVLTDAFSPTDALQHFRRY